jgi:phosphoenolpyruvate carboxylase
MEFEREIFQLLLQHQSAPDAVKATHAGGATGSSIVGEGELSTRVFILALTLWQTALLRLSKLSVSDEIDNGLVFLRRTFLPVVPRLYSELERSLRVSGLVDPTYSLPPFLRVGSWIGGDRDGNPFVNAETLKYAVTKQAQVRTSRGSCATPLANLLSVFLAPKAPTSALRLVPTAVSTGLSLCALLLLLLRSPLSTTSTK